MRIGALMSSRPMLVLLSVAIAIIVGACAPASSTAGDSTAPEQDVIESPTPTPTLSTADIRELLKEATPGFDDLPIGFSLVEELFVANEEAARDALEGQATALDNYDLWGRGMGYVAAYEGTSGIIEIVGAEYYRSASGAESAFDWSPPEMTREKYVAESLAEMFDLGLNFGTDPNFELSRISFPQLGDQSVGYQVIGYLRSGSRGDSIFLRSITMLAVEIRVGNLTGLTFVYPPSGEDESRPAIETLETVARSFERGLKAAAD